MKERPILFSAPMVRAVLAGTKTQTRRVVKGFALELLAPDNFTPEYVALPENGNSPYGYAGDRLWVREAWSTHACFDAIKPADLTTRSIHYAADGYCETGKGRPSIHMPRWASRTTLEIDGVRIERLQDISEQDAKAEGCQVPAIIYPDEPRSSYSYAEQYRLLWESINGAGSWAANPWVWVVEFKDVSESGAA